MKIRLLAVLAVAVALLIGSGPLLAHHAFAWADNEHPITLSGTVMEFWYANPHSQIMVDVKGKEGEIDHWMIEIGPPAALRRAGWSSATIKQGDQITVTGGAAKDGRKILNIAGKLLLNGKELSTHDPNVS